MKGTILKQLNRTKKILFSYIDLYVLGPFYEQRIIYLVSNKPKLLDFLPLDTQIYICISWSNDFYIHQGFLLRTWGIGGWALQNLIGMGGLIRYMGEDEGVFKCCRKIPVKEFI